MIPSSISGDIEVPASVDAQGNVHIGHEIVHNYYVSTDWQKLQQRLTDALENYQSFPEHPKFAQQLQTVQDEIESFKRDVVKLAQDFQKVPLNTERLKQAKAYFDQGDYEKARGVLDTEALGQEQEVLLAEKDAVETKLAANADEFMLLAHLTALNFDLGEERISKACEDFENALMSSKTARRLFEYAHFLEIEKQLKKSENYFTEALTAYEELHKKAPDDMHLIHLGAIHNSLGNLISNDLGRFQEAANYYQEALNIRFDIMDKHLDNGLCVEHVCTSINNLAILLARIPNLLYVLPEVWERAKNLFKQSLSMCRRLERKRPNVLSHTITLLRTVSNLASLLSTHDDINQKRRAFILYSQAIKIIIRTPSNQSIEFIELKVKTLDNFGILLSGSTEHQKQAEYLYIEALEVYRYLAKIKPSIYRTELSRTYMVSTVNPFHFPAKIQ